MPDIWNYFEHRRAEFDQYSAAPDREMFEAAPDGSRGRIFGNLGLGDRAFLRVFERIVVHTDRFEIEKYAYRLLVDEVHIYGWDKHPGHNPAVHCHVGPGEQREDCQEVTLETALEHSWKYLDRYVE
jgi:hypothetical protein